MASRAQDATPTQDMEATMRMMLRFAIPVERGNEAVADGTIGRTFDALLEELEPEAAYFFTVDGERAGLMVFDMTDQAQAPQIAERLFQSLDAAVELMPVLNADDLRRGLAKVSV
jgi:hypothetical protein